MRRARWQGKYAWERRECLLCGRPVASCRVRRQTRGYAEEARRGRLAVCAICVPGPPRVMAARWQRGMTGKCGRSGRQMERAGWSRKR